MLIYMPMLENCIAIIVNIKLALANLIHGRSLLISFALIYWNIAKFLPKGVQLVVVFNCLSIFFYTVPVVLPKSVAHSLQNVAMR